MKPIILLAGAILVGCGGTPTQPTPLTTATPVPTVMEPGRSATISGTVTDTLDQPLAGVNVLWAGLAEAPGDRGHGVMTDAQGAYHLSVGTLGGPGAAEGRFDLYATKDGYLGQMVETALSDTTVNFRLAPVSAALPTLPTLPPPPPESAGKTTAVRERRPE